MHDEKKSGALLTYVYLGIKVVIGIAYTPLMLRYLGQAEYGVYTEAQTVISFLTMLDLGFGQTLIHYNIKYRAENDKSRVDRCNGLFLIMYSVIGLVSLIIGFVCAANCGVLFRKFTPDELTLLTKVIDILVISLAVSFPLSVFSSLINAYERFTVAKIADILTYLLQYGGIFLVLRFGMRSVAMATVTTAVSIAVKLALAVFCMVKIKPRFAFGQFDKTLFRTIFTYSVFIFLNIVIDQLYADTDKFILGAVCSSAAVTTYNVGVQFSAYFQQLSSGISGVFLPQITKIYSTSHDVRPLSEIFIRIGRLQFIILSFVMSGFIAFGQEFIRLLAGPENAVSYWIAMIIIVPSIIPLSQNIGIAILQAMNQHKFRSLIYFFIALLNVVVSIPLAKLYQGVGSALGTTLACFLGQYLTMNLFYSRKIGIDIKGYWRAVGNVTLRMLPMAIPGFAINLIPGTGWLIFLVRVILYTVVYIPYAWKFICGDYERRLAAPIVSKLRRGL
jgi:O-antigen/teichoic acid export membrane protein